jgi:MFS family permease
LSIATVAYVPELPQRAAGYVDVAGALLVSAGLAALLLAISQGGHWGWSSDRIIGLFVAATGLLTLFAIVEARVSQPLVNLALIARRPFANANLCALLFGFAFFLASYLIPQIATSPEATGYGLALSTTQTGVLLTPSCVIGFAAGWVGGRVVTRVGPRALVMCGAAVGAAAYVWLAVAHSSVEALLAGSTAIGISWGLILTGVYSVVMRSAATESSGVAAAVVVTARITGTAVGVQAAFAVIAAAGLVESFPASAGFTRAFEMGAIGAAATLAAAAFLPGRRRHGRSRGEIDPTS